MNIIETSPNGNLRLRQFKNGNGVVELRSRDEWVYCAFKSLPMERAHEVFNSQVRHHQ